jgi:hypothetical protein
LVGENVAAAPVHSERDGGMHAVFLARYAERMTLSRRIGLDFAQHPVEQLMGAHEWMRRVELAMRRAGEGSD